MFVFCQLLFNELMTKTSEIKEGHGKPDLKSCSDAQHLKGGQKVTEFTCSGGHI